MLGVLVSCNVHKSVMKSAQGPILEKYFGNVCLQQQEGIFKSSMIYFAKPVNNWRHDIISITIKTWHSAQYFILTPI
jgi:hypothetical protein